MMDVGKPIRRNILYAQLYGLKTAESIDSFYSKTFEKMKKKALKESTKNRAKAVKTVSRFCCDLLHSLEIMMLGGGKDYSVEKGLSHLGALLGDRTFYVVDDDLIKKLNHSIKIAARNSFYLSQILVIYKCIWKNSLYDTVLVSTKKKKELDAMITGLHNAVKEHLSAKPVANIMECVYDLIDITLFRGSYDTLMDTKETNETEETNLKNRIDLAIGLVGIFEFIVANPEYSKDEKNHIFETVDIRKLVDDCRTVSFISVASKNAEQKRVLDALSILGKKIEKEYDVPFSF